MNLNEVTELDSRVFIYSTSQHVTLTLVGYVSEGFPRKRDQPPLNCLGGVKWCFLSNH